MVIVAFDPFFKKEFSKIKDNLLKQKIIKQISKIKDNPNIGKPMKYNRKNTRELYISPYRISYSFLKNEDKILILSIYHKDFQ